MKQLIDTLAKGNFLTKNEFAYLLTNFNADILAYANEQALKIKMQVYGKDVFIRGLVEITNYCKNDCLYCGIRRANKYADRYRLNKEQILECCTEGYDLGFRTLVLQGGEDNYYNDDLLCDIVANIKQLHSDMAVTLSLGERSYESYKRLRDAGADRYLLRHETANADHYSKLHPEIMSHANRIECLHNLKQLGYQTGTGFMVGSPFQTAETLYEDLCFIKEFRPAMVGIGPFIPHHETPFSKQAAGSVEMTLLLLSILRLMLPNVLLPATTALGSLKDDGRERGILAGANVIMPNLSPKSVREKYMIYDNKLSSGGEAAENLASLKKQIEKIGSKIVVSRGDSLVTN